MAEKEYQPITIDPVRLTNQYFSRNDWRTKESSSATYSVGALSNYMSGAITSAYWLDDVYPEEIAISHRSCDLHLHDLGAGGLQSYCSGWNLRQLLEEGLGGVKDKIQSGPACHLNSAMQQIVNFLGIMSNCWAEDTPILFSDGSIKTFKQCKDLNITEAEIIAYNPIIKKYVKKNAHNIGIRSENSPLVEIELETGEKIKCEPWQHLLTSNRGYVEAQELLCSDDIIGF